MARGATPLILLVGIALYSNRSYSVFRINYYNEDEYSFECIAAPAAGAPSFAEGTQGTDGVLQAITERCTSVGQRYDLSRRERDMLSELVRGRTIATIAGELGVSENTAKAQANVTSLASCNMYLMGRKAANPVRRGPTRLKQLMAAGVNCCYASDNIRDAWRPYGNADMMQEAMVAAHCMQSAFPDELETVWKMGTYNAAKNALVEGYGVEEGCNADLVVLDAPSADLALIGQAKKLYVVKGGKVEVCQDFGHYAAR